jgi:protein TonB
MPRNSHRLLLALGASLLLHFLPLAVNLEHAPAPQPPPPAPLAARLQPPPTPPAPPPLALPEQPTPAASAPQPRPVKAPPRASPPAERPPVTATTWTQSVRQQFERQEERGQFYPAEAIAQGLEGEVLVLIIIDPAGNVTAARVEQGSGHRILDEAALRAVRALRSLPADAPRDALLPVRFRLR